jgi:asparagine synthase (glutamine-hydrolysing)
MCGILGIASRTGIQDRAWLAVGRDSMRHRGPDDTGEWWAPDGRAGLGHLRLAIVDLSYAGHQPMLDAEAGLSLSFNGEIYNFLELRQELLAAGHSFVSGSDTEVVLKAYRQWGTDCLARLRGMFALALYDVRRQQLFLARDRAGEKPLFYALSEETIRFASELKGLMADPRFVRRVDPEALDCYLSDGFVPGERCVLQGVCKLPAAHALTFDCSSGRSRVWRYWQPPRLGSSATLDKQAEAGLLDELESLLESAVRLQLVADVPVGVLLSGGVDSSLITAMAVRASPNVKTFTVRLPGYGKYDETAHARLIADHFAPDHVELEAELSSVQLLPMLARQFDEPVVDSSMVPTYLVSRLVREHCTVALGGDGGDELFGGYSHYDRLLRMAQTAGRIPRLARLPLALLGERILPVGFRGRNWLQALSTDLRRDVPAIATYFDRKARRRLLSARAARVGAAERIRASRQPSGGDLLQRAMRLDFENYLAEDILVKVDRASMLNSLEVRAPMLDVGVIEFAFAKLPARLKATVNGRKIMLKRLAARVLPPAFDQTRKQGFSLPLASWLVSGAWREFFLEVLLDRSQTIFDRHFVRELFAGQDRGRANSERLFGLVMFELWRREYRVDIGG